MAPTKEQQEALQYLLEIERTGEALLEALRKLGDAPEAITELETVLRTVGWHEERLERTWNNG